MQEDSKGITWGEPPATAKAVEPDIIKVGRRAFQKALEVVEQLTDVEPNKIAVPWQQEERPKIETDKWLDSRLRSWDITELKATQKFIKRDDLVWQIENFDNTPEGQHQNPNVVVVNGKPLIYDGHHRLSAIWLMGAETANCWTLEI